MECNEGQESDSRLSSPEYLVATSSSLLPVLQSGRNRLLKFLGSLLVFGACITEQWLWAAGRN